MTKLLVTVELDPHHADLENVKQRLDLSDEQIDRDFGVVSIDPAAHLYAVLVDEDAATAAAQLPGVKGPYANPRIETFGPPEPS